MEEWRQNLADQFGKNLLYWRKTKRGLTAQKLSDLTEHIGPHISRGTIAKIEGNHRGGKIEVSELITLARALDVPPAILLFPRYPSGLVSLFPDEMLGSFTCPAFFAAEWFAGRSTLPLVPVDEGDAVVMKQGTDQWERMVKLVDEREALAAETYELLDGPLAEVIEAGLEHVPREARLRAERFLNEKKQHRDRIEELNTRIEALGGFIGDEGGDDATA